MVNVKRKMVATCLAVPSSAVDLQHTAPQQKVVTTEDSVNATQIYEAPVSKEKIPE